MSAIETCRTAALGGHVERCEDCAHDRVAYNSCRNRHCPKCQAAAARQWLEDREAELLPVPYYPRRLHPAGGDRRRSRSRTRPPSTTCCSRRAAETLTTIAADPKHLGARIGLTAVLHTWGSALTHHPHVHVIVPGGGLSPDGSRWIACKPGFFLPVRVLSRLFRRLFLEGLAALHAAGRLAFFGDLAPLADEERLRRRARAAAPLRMGRLRQAAVRRAEGRARLSRRATPTASPSPTPGSSRSTTTGVTFKWKDYRIEGRDRLKTMTLDARRVHPPLSPARAAERLPPHPPLRPVRQRGARAQHRARPRSCSPRRRPRPSLAPRPRAEPKTSPRRAACPCCGGRMIIIETFEGVRPARPRLAEPDQDRHLMTIIAPLHAFKFRAPSPPTSSGAGPPRPKHQFQPVPAARLRKQFKQNAPDRSPRRRPKPQIPASALETDPALH